MFNCRRSRIQGLISEEEEEEEEDIFVSNAQDPGADPDESSYVLARTQPQRNSWSRAWSIVRNLETDQSAAAPYQPRTPLELPRFYIQVLFIRESRRE